MFQYTSVVTYVCAIVYVDFSGIISQIFQIFGQKFRIEILDSGPECFHVDHFSAHFFPVTLTHIVRVFEEVLSCGTSSAYFDLNHYEN